MNKKGIEIAFQPIIVMAIGLVVVVLLIFVIKGQIVKVRNLSSMCGEGIYSDYSSTCYTSKPQNSQLCIPVDKASCQTIQGGDSAAKGKQLYCCKLSGG